MIELEDVPRDREIVVTQETEGHPNSRDEPETGLEESKTIEFDYEKEECRKSPTAVVNVYSYTLNNCQNIHFHGTQRHVSTTFTGGDGTNFAPYTEPHNQFCTTGMKSTGDSCGQTDTEFGIEMNQKCSCELEIDGGYTQFADAQNAVERNDHPVSVTGNSFIPTRAFLHARNCLQNNHVVFIIGGPGEGKTTILQNLRRCMESNGYSTINVSHPADIESSLGVGGRTLLVCDDIFGGVYACRDKVKAWSKSLLPDQSICNPSCAVKIAISCCSRTWQRYQEDFGHVSLLQDPVWVCSSKLTREEKVQMIRAHVAHSGAAVNSSHIRAIASITDAVAFPYSCRIVATECFINEIGHAINNLADTFRNPVNFLSLALKQMKDQSRLTYFTAVLLAFRGGALSCAELKKLLQQEETWKLFRALFMEDIEEHENLPQNVATFISSQGSRFLQVHDDEEGNLLFSLSHHIVADAIIHELARTHVNRVLEFAPPDFILEKCRLKTCLPRDAVLDDSFIWLDPDSYAALTVVLTEEVIGGNAPQAFANPAVRAATFQAFWMDYLKRLPVEKQFCFANSHFLRYLVSQLKEKEFMQYVMERSSARPAQGYDTMQVLYRAATGGQFLLLNKMRHGKLDVLGENNQSACSFVSLLGKREALTTLLRFGCNPNIQDVPSKKSALHHATERGYRKLVGILIAFGAEVNIEDKDDVRPLHLASSRGFPEIAQDLIDAGAVVDIVDRWGTSPLHHAAEHGQEEVARLLVKNGASIHLKDTNHRTALHFAGKRGHTAVLSFLRRQGGDIKQEDVWNKSALDYATKNEI